MKCRVEWIDIARGIRIILVVIGHLCEGVKPLHNIIYSFHMPLFFFLSGYCFKEQRSWKDFIINKIRTIIIPWVILGLLTYFVYAILNGYEEALYLFKDIFFSIGALWFLPVLAISSVLQHIILKCKISLQYALTAIVLSSGLILSIC